MPVPCRSSRWIWAGRALAGLILVAVGGYLVRVGLDTADKLASSISLLVAIAALLAPYLLPAPPSPAPQTGGPSMPDADHVEDSGKAEATSGGQANTGLRTTDRSGSAQVTRSGDARADGPGSVANTGIYHQPEPHA